MQAALEHLIYLWKGCLSSFVPVRSLLRSKVALGPFSKLSPWCDGHSTCTESCKDRESPPALQEHSHSGHLWGGELGVCAEFSRTAYGGYLLFVGMRYSRLSEKGCRYTHLRHMS